jgi:hypothetical protein
VFICFWIKSAGTTSGFLTGCIVHTEGLTSVILRGLLCNREARISSFPSVPRVSTCTYFDLCAHAVYTVYEYFCFFDFCLMHGSVHLKAGARSTLQVLQRAKFNEYWFISHLSTYDVYMYIVFNPLSGQSFRL